MTTADLAYTSAVELAARVRRGDLSPVEVTDAFLDRIAERNPAINAFVHVLDEEARERAHLAERTLASGGEVGRLLGVPVGLKDLFGFKAGVPNTFGSRLLTDYVPAESEVFVDRIEGEGAVVLGKTNTPEFGLGTTTDNLVFGQTHTPFDVRRNAGGSSGGSAAAVADGLVPFAQGSDAGGSIRIPASFCGVYGFKPTFGRVPMVQSMRPNAFARHTPYTNFGPITRTVEDAALFMDVMAGHHPGDPFTVPDDGTDYVAATRRSIADARVAYSPDFGIYPVADEVEAVVDDAAADLETAGATVERVDPDFGGRTQADVLDAFYVFARVLWNHVLENFQNELGVDPFGADREKIRPVFRETVMDGPEVTGREYKRADVTRTDVYDGLNALFEEYDLLVTPTLGVTAFDPDDPPTHLGGREIDPARGWVMTQPYNLSGHPAASVPAGLDGDGLPVALQVAAPKYDDAAVLAASAALERVRPWADSYPPR